MTTTNEPQIEKDFISRLCSFKYIYRPDIRDRATLEKNFRNKFQELNKVNLSDSEFTRLLEQIISSDVFANAKHLREINSFERDDGTPFHYTLVDIKDWCKNSFEVVNQLRINTDNSYHRYDVILLINGVPVVQVELKTLTISPRNAMQQIVEYKNDVGNGYTRTLLCFIQLFIVSNRSETYYFSNNNTKHFSFNADERYLPIYRFADENNKKINHLDEFTKLFLAKCTLGEMISRYIVLVASEQKLLIMRPYQIYAVKNIVESIHQNRGNGYIWHTTGSGKTLTSFKASTLLKDNPDIDKCLFVVDRKDLDKQTREEFNKFQIGCVEENTNTETLVRRLLSDNYSDKVIVTTIQKLGRALDNTKEYKARLSSLQNKRMVFIFDECHRSQFGENHHAIKSFFPKAQLFGFTGTPIFEENSNYQQIEGNKAEAKTTNDLFKNLLHKYTITHAIDDRNVLRFHVEYYKPKGKDKPKHGEALTKRAIIEAILEKHSASTQQRKFNAILATASINDAIEYYNLFKAIQADKQMSNTSFQPLNIACVFSPPAETPETKQIQEDLPQERTDYETAPDEKKSALKNIITDYNNEFNTNHDINNFDLYYQDIQKRIKDQQYPNSDLHQKEKIDITIVVDMLLTGFDTKYLNTLYVDKNLKYHGLIQAFSRTNRVLNDTKPYGNVIDFRAQTEQVDTAIALFSGEDRAEQAKTIWLVEDAPTMVKKFNVAVKALADFMESHELPLDASEVANLKGDTARIQFLTQFKEIQRIKTQLDQYTDLTPKHKTEIESAMPENDFRAFRGVYLETAKQIKESKPKDDFSSEVAQLDFEFVLFSTAVIDYDYIMGLMSRYTYSTAKVKMNKEDIVSLIQSDAKFVDEKDTITEYLNSLKIGDKKTEEEIKKGYVEFKNTKLWGLFKVVADKHSIDFAKLQTMVNQIIGRMIFSSEGLETLVAPMNLGWKERAQKEQAIMADLISPLKRMAEGKEISGLEVYEVYEQ